MGQQQNGTIVSEAASAALTSAKENLEWQQSIEGDLRTAFGLPQINNIEPVNGSSSTYAKMFLLILASLFMIYH